MKRGNSDKRWKQRAAPHCGGRTGDRICIAAGGSGSPGGTGSHPDRRKSGGTAVLLFYAVTGLAVALGVLVAMRQRLRELDQGEEEDAKKY